MGTDQIPQSPSHVGGTSSRVPTWLAWIGDKFAGPVVVGVLLATFGVWASPLIAERLTSPTCDNPKELQQAHATSFDGQAKPDDHFPARGDVSYAATNLGDGNTSTAWVEGLPGLGIGAKVTLTFAQPVDVRLICLVDGYAESWDLYKRNSRARLLSVDTEQGTREALLSDAGTPDRPAVYQQANVPQGDTGYVTFTLESAYAAQRDSTATTAYPDTSISEIEVWVSS